MDKPPVADILQRDREKHRRLRLGDHAYERFEGKEYEVMSVDEELAAYLAGWTPSHLLYIDKLSQGCLDRPLPADLSAYVIIPVAAGQERETLAATLAQYATQDADPDSWALMLYINAAQKDGESFCQAAIRETRAIVDEFTRQHPHLTIRVVSNIYADQPTIGEIRADAWDIALYDIHKHCIDNDNLIGITHDADSEDIASQYIKEMQTAAILHPLADILTCKLLWGILGDEDSDYDKIIRYWEYIDTAKYKELGVIRLSDANAAIRIGSFLAIDGFKRNCRLCELADIRYRLEIARRLPPESTQHIHFIDDITLTTNSRRLYRALAMGLPPDYAWRSNSLPFLTGLDPVRLLDMSTIANRQITPEVRAAILEKIDQNNLYKLHPNDSLRVRQLGRQALSLPLL